MSEREALEENLNASGEEDWGGRTDRRDYELRSGLLRTC